MTIELHPEKIRENIAKLMKAIGANQSTCKGCGTTVWWVTHKNGKKAPYTADALIHFADCPNAKNFRK